VYFTAGYEAIKKKFVPCYSLSWKSLESHLNVSQSKFFDLFRRAYFLLFPRNKAKKLPVRQLKAIPETSKKDYNTTIEEDAISYTLDSYGAKAPSE